MLIKDITRLNPLQEKALKKMRVENIFDLLFYFPLRYGDTAEAITINNLTPDALSTIFGKVKKSETKKSFRGKVPMAEMIVEDDTGEIKVVFFSQAYIAKMYPVGSLVRIQGTVKSGKNGLSIVNPHIESVAKVPDGVGDSLFGESGHSHSLYPVYRESRGITSNWIYHTLQRVFATDEFKNLHEYIPEEILKKYNLPSLKSALIWIHTPQKREDALAARKRFAFEEIFLIQLKKQKERKEIYDEKPFVVDIPEMTIDEFSSRFPFQFTEGQNTAIEEILSDFRSGHPMSRLLHGDVGSGKTAVAATTAYAVVKTRPKVNNNGNIIDQKFGSLQVAYMAPTEILAKQHFESFIEFFRDLPIPIALITGSGCYKFPSKVNPNKPTNISRSQLMKWVKNGEIPILIGTHALIQKSVAWKHLAYVIIDEQHRFGTKQRQALARKDSVMPHLLSMTATPIPRTLALTLYGDLDLTILSQMPKGRKDAITEIIGPRDRKNVYELMREKLEEGRQVYVICPRINDSDDENALKTVSAESEAKRLKKEIFPDYSIGVLHSKMTPVKKDEVMKDFGENKIQILVATSVVEVGVNVPNATVILIEGADRFGLAQLHQLRGRVLRSTHTAYCFLATDSDSAVSKERLHALKKAKNGFELSEYDLSLRGAGSLVGGKQWGITDIGMEAIRNLKLVEAARKEAIEIINKEKLSDYPPLERKVLTTPDLHFE